MSTAHYSRERVMDALEHARNTTQLGITKIKEWPTAPDESPMITVTATDADEGATETTITLESDGSGIYRIEGPKADIRDSIHLIAEKAIA